MNLVTILAVDRVKCNIFLTDHKFWTKVPRKEEQHTYYQGSAEELTTQNANK